MEDSKDSNNTLPYPTGPSAGGQPEQPPPYSPPPPGQGLAYPPPSMYPPAQPPPGQSAVVYQTAPTANSGPIIRSTQHQTTTTQQVYVVGGARCPQCQVGILQENFTLLGICCAIFFFPIGLLCCLMMRQRVCTNCGAVFM